MSTVLNGLIPLERVCNVLSVLLRYCKYEGAAIGDGGDGDDPPHAHVLTRLDTRLVLRILLNEFLTERAQKLFIMQVTAKAMYLNETPPPMSMKPVPVTTTTTSNKSNNAASARRSSSMLSLYASLSPLANETETNSKNNNNPNHPTTSSTGSTTTQSGGVSPSMLIEGHEQLSLAQVTVLMEQFFPPFCQHVSESAIEWYRLALQISPSASVDPLSLRAAAEEMNMFMRCVKFDLSQFIPTNSNFNIHTITENIWQIATSKATPLFHPIALLNRAKRMEYAHESDTYIFFGRSKELSSLTKVISAMIDLHANHIMTKKLTTSNNNNNSQAASSDESTGAASSTATVCTIAHILHDMHAELI